MSSEQNIVAFPEADDFEALSVYDQAAYWVAKLDGDKPSEDTLAAFSQWVNASPAHVAEYEKLVARWDSLNVLTQLHLPDEAAVKVTRWGYGMGAAVCASVVLLVALMIAPFDNQQSIYSTAIGEQKTITLADNSVIKLNTNSRLKIDYSDSRRGIYLLQGEAYFEVAHQPNRPFEVYTGTGVVRAVGTAFSVYLNNQQVEVLVNEGIVEVDKLPPLAMQASAPQATAITSTSTAATTTKEPLATKANRVRAGSKATFNQHTPLQLALDEEAAVEKQLSWRKGSLIFSQEKLQTLVDEVSRYTSTRIIITDNAARDIRVGGLFEVGNTEAVLDALELGFGIQVDRIDDELVYLSTPNKKM